MTTNGETGGADQPRYPPYWHVTPPSPWRIVLFFAVCGALLGNIALCTQQVYAIALDWVNPQPPKPSVIPFYPGPGFLIEYVMAAGLVLGAGWGAICSGLAVRALRRKIIWKAACWIVPTCSALAVLLELFMPAWWRRNAFTFILSAPLLVLTFVCIARRLPNHRMIGQCGECGYDLRGNVSGICPECGTPIPKFERGGESRAD
jgi:hypothetical protein